MRKTTEAFNNLLSRDVEAKLHRSWGSSDSLPDAVSFISDTVSYISDVVGYILTESYISDAVCYTVFSISDQIYDELEGDY